MGVDSRSIARILGDQRQTEDINALKDHRYVLLRHLCWITLATTVALLLFEYTDAMGITGEYLKL